jgi:hypothetical protein
MFLKRSKFSLEIQPLSIELVPPSQIDYRPIVICRKGPGNRAEIREYVRLMANLC